jgi:tRNA A-37 threonylcarbamoyl transferase component Bud32
MAQRLTVDDRTVWLKRYGSGTRRLALGVLDHCARGLDIEALRPPPRHPGDFAKRLEVRRLQELRAADVRVPEVIGDGHSVLMLADIGESLSRQLTRSANDEPARDALVVEAVAAIADVHAKAHYLGQPMPRNMAVDGQGIGFLDFEEDPGEVMSLDDAQARDWLMFVYGVAHYYRSDTGHLASLIEQGLALGNPSVAHRVSDAGLRLRVIETLVKPFRGRAWKLIAALRTLRSIASAALIAAAILIIDFIPDGDIDLFAWNLLGILV